MDGAAKVILSVVLLFEYILKDAAGTLFCSSPQYVILGEKGILECSFPNKFHTIAWYDSPNTAEALVTKIEKQGNGTSEVSGDGYESGAYDIYLNGSLIIPSVTTYHERTFRVVLIDESGRVSIRDINSTTIDAAGTLFCSSPQYVILGEKGILKCSFPNQFHTIAWYDSPNNTAEALVTKIEKQENGTSEVSGDGYESGAYDIYLNGSLIIPSVTTYHDRTFRVVLIGESGRVSIRDIASTTIVHPLQTTAAVNLCGADDHCFVNSMETSILNCKYTGARPPVELTWYSYSGEKMSQVSTAAFSDENYTFTSISSLDISGFTERPLTVFICEASGPALDFKNITTSVFVYNIQTDVESHYANVTERNVILNSTLIISCTDTRIPTVFVWSFKRTDTTSTLLTSANGKADVTDNLNDSFEVSKDGALHFEQVDDSTEGLFTCIYLKGDVSSLKMVRVTIVESIAVQDEADETLPNINAVVIVLLIMIMGLLCSVGFGLLCCVVFLRKQKNDEEYFDAVGCTEDLNESPDSLKMLSLLSSSTEEENYANEKGYADIDLDSLEKLPNEEDCPADESVDPTNPDTPEEEQGSSESGAAMGAALTNLRVIFDHQDEQVDSIEDLAKGDHIVLFGWVFHPRCHGIVVDTNIEMNELKLIRFTYDKGVVEEWKKWNPPIYKVLKYYIGDKSLKNNIYDPDVVIERARKMLNNTNMKYNIGMNNCKTFAKWCKTGATPPGYGYDD